VLWDIGTGEPVHTFSGHLGPVVVVAISPGGRFAISGSTDRTLRLWDLDQRTCQATIPLESSPIALAIGPDGRTVVVGDRVGNVHLLQIHLT
jgi:WD40 repeat protein